MIFCTVQLVIHKPSPHSILQSASAASYDAVPSFVKIAKSSLSDRHSDGIALKDAASRGHCEIAKFLLEQEVGGEGLQIC